jgi:hypothetical protein
MGEKRQEEQERTHKMAEELSKLQPDTCLHSGTGSLGGFLPGGSQHACVNRISGALQGPHGRRGGDRRAPRVPRLRNYGLRNSINREPECLCALWITRSKVP